MGYDVRSTVAAILLRHTPPWPATSTTRTPAPFMKRLGQDAPMNPINPLGTKEFEMGDIDPRSKAQENMTTSVIQNAPLPQVGLAHRFPISDKEL